MESIEQRRHFLTARWVNLALITYAVDPTLLQPSLPPGCELDLRDGHAFVSLVAFDFFDTRVMGIAWPGFRNFPEINLRFYVRHRENRGVCFIQEFVPQRLVCLMARLFYNEPYRAAAMLSKTVTDQETIKVEHELRFGQTRNRLRITGSAHREKPSTESVEHFFKEHSWGFGKSRRGGLLQYRVMHPEWEIYPVRSWNLDWDFAAVYGERWEILQSAEPYSVIFAAGSGVRLYPKA